MAGRRVEDATGRFDRNCQLLIVGTFPPPSTGASVANAAVMGYLVSVGARVVSLDTAPKTLDRRLSRRLGRVPKLVRAWARIIELRVKERKRQCTVYLSAAGGWGLAYDVLTILLARILRFEILVHHHNWTYFDRSSALAHVVMWLGGKRAHHIVLCDGMGRLLEKRYGILRWEVLSNIFLVKQPLRPRIRKKLRTVGFISNLTVEKGTLKILELARLIRRRRWGDVNVVLAGPCSDTSLTAELRAAERDGLIEWRGAVYGDEKESFWNEVDVFVFPSSYANEAEPIVVWEAMTSGSPVIAYGRGCIADQLGGQGVIVATREDFSTVAMGYLQKWREEPRALEEASRDVLAVAAWAREASYEQLRKLAMTARVLP